MKRILLIIICILAFPTFAHAGAIQKAPNNLGLVGYWSFDDCRKATASDSSGNGNTGTLTNFALTGATSNWVSGTSAKRGCALNFDGVNDKVSVGPMTSVVGRSAVSVSAWVKVAQVAAVARPSETVTTEITEMSVFVFI